MGEIKRKGFTLIELLTVMGIIALLAGILLPVLSKVREYAWRTRARDSVYQVFSAWKSYLSDYRKFPDLTITEMNPGALNILGTTNTFYNDTYIYMDFTTNEWINGFIDPWNTLYQVALDNGKGGDANAYDGRVMAGPYGTIERPIAIWSKGPDKADSTPAERKDDLKSW